MIDFAFLEDSFVLLVMVACLLIGYIIKHSSLFKWLPNNDIPVVLALVGAVLNLFVSGVTVESVIYGALTGLASTGCHQAFKHWIDKDNQNAGE